MVLRKDYKVARVVKRGPIQTRTSARRNFRIWANRGTLYIWVVTVRHPILSPPDLLYDCRELSGGGSKIDGESRRIGRSDTRWIGEYPLRLPRG